MTISPVVFVFERIPESEDQSKFICAVNFTPVARMDYKFGIDEEVELTEVLNSDENIYAGSGIVNTGK